MLVVAEFGAQVAMFSWRQGLDYGGIYPATMSKTTEPFFGPDARLKLMYAGQSWDAHLEGGYACLTAIYQINTGSSSPPYTQSACVAEAGIGASWHF